MLEEEAEMFGTSVTAEDESETEESNEDNTELDSELFDIVHRYFIFVKIHIKYIHVYLSLKFKN